MNKRFYIFSSLLVLLQVFFLPISKGQQLYTISGFVSEQGSQERLPGVSIYLPELKTGTTTNTYGFYSISLPAGNYKILYSFVGYTTAEKTLKLEGDLELPVELELQSQELEGVEIIASRQERPSQVPQMSRIQVPVELISKMPGFLGEKDVLKTLQLLPGVQSGNEGNSGLYVRGGGADQNLLLLDDAVVYNASHLFGFFSVFNGDALKNVELYKGGFPARFGGRLSSVVKMDMKEGHREGYHGKASVGLLSSSMVLEGPLVKNKSSFLLAGRRSYADLLMKPFMSRENQVGYYFYDWNAKLNTELGKKDRLYASGYFGRDQYSMKDGSSQTDNYVSGGIEWGNATLSLRWNHLFNDKLFANASLLLSDYQFDTFEEEYYNDVTYHVGYSTAIRDYGFKYDLDYVPNQKHYLRAGVQGVLHHFTPSAFVVTDEWSGQFQDQQETTRTTEAGLYVEDLWKPTDRLHIEAGLRLSYFKHREREQIRPEPRFSAAYFVNDRLSVKASYAQMNQYTHLLTNSGLGLPTDLWVPATERVPPQQSRQVALGVAKDFPDRGINLSLEGYYKHSDQILNYKEGASFLVLEDPSSARQVNWEDNVTSGRGWAYGGELFIQKKHGKFNGWAGYTLSWTRLQFDQLNQGRPFWAKHDRRHDISLAGTYELKKGVTLSASWVYGTGNALTMSRWRVMDLWHSPSGEESYSQQSDYLQERGNFRAEAYHRLDIGMQFHKQKKYWKRTWDIGLYNAYNRKNPYFYETRTVPTPKGIRTILMKNSLFPILPGISYRIEF